MSYPSGQSLMNQLVSNPELPEAVRVEAMRDQDYRPSLSILLKIIRDTSTPKRLRAAAILKYNREVSIRELAHASRTSRTEKVAEVTSDQT